VLRFISSFFTKRSEAVLEKKISKKRVQAMKMQRNGNLRGYAELMKEIDSLEKQILEAQNESR
tara:strand:- start:236 stop:424 length:189 start_codon:yes stop_codon:yes gene_type:complete